MVWNKTAAGRALDKRNEEQVLQRELGLGQTTAQVHVHDVSSEKNRTKAWYKRNDEEMGEGQLDLDEAQAHIRDLGGDPLSDTERRKICLETAREYAGMTDFKSARRYLEANYLGPNPWLSEEDKKLLANIQLKQNKKAAEHSVESDDNTEASSSQCNGKTKSDSKPSTSKVKGKGSVSRSLKGSQKSRGRKDPNVVIVSQSQVSRSSQISHTITNGTESQHASSSAQGASRDSSEESDAFKAQTGGGCCCCCCSFLGACFA